MRGGRPECLYVTPGMYSNFGYSRSRSSHPPQPSFITSLRRCVIASSFLLTDDRQLTTYGHLPAPLTRPLALCYPYNAAEIGHFRAAASRMALETKHLEVTLETQVESVNL